MGTQRLLVKLGGTLASDEGGARDLTETVGVSTSVEDIWSGLISVETDHGAVAGAAAAGRYYWPMTDIYWRYFVGAHVSLGYLGWDQRQSRTSMTQSKSLERTILVAT